MEFAYKSLVTLVCLFFTMLLFISKGGYHGKT